MMIILTVFLPTGSLARGLLRQIVAAALLLSGSFVALAATGDVPPFLSADEARKPQRTTISPERFSDPQVRRAYTIAKKRSAVLAQQPCYCWCSRMGHHSLLSCYQNEHASQCSICIKEAFLADQLTQQGKTPAQVREAVQRGDWRDAQ